MDVSAADAAASARAAAASAAAAEHPSTAPAAELHAGTSGNANPDRRILAQRVAENNDAREEEEQAASEGEEAEGGGQPISLPTALCRATAG